MVQPEQTAAHRMSGLVPGANTLAGALGQTMDEAIEALSVCDADRLEAIKDRIHGMTVECLTRELAEGREALPELLRKHTMLGEMLQATAANLKVVAAVLEAKRNGYPSRPQAEQNRSNLVPWPR